MNKREEKPFNLFFEFNLNKTKTNKKKEKEKEKAKTDRRMVKNEKLERKTYFQEIADRYEYKDWEFLNLESAYSTRYKNEAMHVNFSNSKNGIYSVNKENTEKYTRISKRLEKLAIIHDTNSLSTLISKTPFL